MRTKRILSVFLTICLLCLCLTGCGKQPQDPGPGGFPGGNGDPGNFPGGNGGLPTVEGGFPEYESSPSEEAVFRAPAEADTSGAVRVTLNGTSATAGGPGVSVDGSVITVTKGGTYLFEGTLEDGRIIVDTADEKVTLVFAGADVTCSWGSPFYVYDAKKTVLHLLSGTENSLTDGSTYTFDDSRSSASKEEPDACLYSKDDLVIQGAGSLAVHANYKNGITCKDDLEIYDASITVESVKHGINGKDSLVIGSARITVNAAGDGLRSSNDTNADKGNVRIADSEIVIVSGGDGIQSEQTVTLGKGSYHIVSGGGSSVRPNSDDSAKGVKTGASLTVTGGNFVLDCSDDALHSNSAMVLDGGCFSISSYDDAVHADKSLSVNGGTYVISACYEGLEAEEIAISGGEIAILSSDDGLNAAGGNDGSGYGGFGGDWSSSSTGSLSISGGTQYVVARGDGLDSNGTITMTGGGVTVFNTAGGNGALDYGASFTLSGGTLFACGVGSMDTAPSSATQYTMFLGLTENLSAGSTAEFRCGDRNFTYYVPVSVSTVVFSDPGLASGETWTLSCGGEELAEVTLSSLLTISGVNGGFPGWGGPGGGRP